MDNISNRKGYILKLDKKKISEIATTAYLAGLLDMKASITIEARPDTKTRILYYSTVFLVLHKDKNVIDALIETFGGLDTQKGAHYVWRISGRELESMLNRVIPFLFFKKNHAIIMIDFIEQSQKNSVNLSDNQREQQKKLYIELKELNKK